METAIPSNENLIPSDDKEESFIGFKCEKEFKERIELFAEKSLRSKTHAVKFLILKGFELLEQEGVQA